MMMLSERLFLGAPYATYPFMKRKLFNSNVKSLRKFLIMARITKFDCTTRRGFQPDERFHPDSPTGDGGSR